MKNVNMILVVLMFLLVYHPPIFSLNIIYVISPVSLMILVYESLFEKRKIKINKMFLIMLIVFLLISIQQTMLSILNKFNVLNSISTYVFFVFGILPVALLVFNFKHYFEITYDDMINNIIAIGVIQALFSILAYFNSGFQNWFIKKLVAYGFQESRFTALASFRWYGLADQLGFTTPLVQAVISLICVYLTLTKGTRYLFFAFITAFSMLINARTAVVIYLVGLVYVIMYYLYINNKVKAIKKVFFGAILFSALIVILLNIMKIVAPQNYLWAIRGLVYGVLGRQEEEGMYTMSSDFFFDKSNWPMPEGIDFVFGTGYNLSQGMVQYYSDIGYVNDIWKYGIVFSIVLYYLFVKMCMTLKNTEFGKMISGLLIICFFTANLKGYLISMNTFTPLVFLICLTCREHNVDKKGIEVENKVCKM